MAFFEGRAGRLTAKNGGFRPVQYVSVLADRNYRCIRVEQTETSEARDARKKGSQVRREVVGIVSAGTCMEEEMLLTGPGSPGAVKRPQRFP
jgi:DNA mismatch repair ATPase MutS